MAQPGSAPLGTTEFDQFGPLFVYWPVTWWEAVRLYLKDDARLAGLGAGTDSPRIYLRRAPARLTYPCLIITPIQSTAMGDTTEDYWESWDVQFSVLSRDDPTNGVYADVQAETIGRLAYRVLSPKQRQPDGTVTPRPRIAAIDGYEMGVVPGWTRLMEAEGRTTGNVNAWQFVFQYTFLVGRSLVAAEA